MIANYDLTAATVTKLFVHAFTITLLIFFLLMKHA